jgi:hypothetical protein
MPEWEIL